MDDESALRELPTDRQAVLRASPLRTIARSLAAVPTGLSSYAFLVVLLATIAAKTYSVHSTLHGGWFFFEALGACAADLLVYPLLALLLAAGERTRRWLAYLTYPLSLLAVVVALINAAYVAIANDQIDARVLEVGMNRFDEVADIALLEALRRAGYLGAYALLALPLLFVLVRLGWRRAGTAADELGRLRIRGLSYLSVLGLTAFLAAQLAGSPRALAAELIADNALLHTYVTWVDKAFAPLERDEGALEKHFAPPLIAKGAMSRMQQGVAKPNVLMLVLESTRFDHVELPIEGRRAAARTPNLRALAERGTFFTNAHASMPHTSKSLVSLLCGRLPAMENIVLEVADGVLHQCLPELLRSAGYATTFIQSAIGSFEYRPRMTLRLGYESFGAFETIGARPLGYLSGDDRTLPPAFAKWLASIAPERPFFATLLTSGTHHPYQVPADIAPSDVQDGRARYAALVELEDRVLGSLIDLLERSQRLNNTVILAVADHGEGLRGDPVLQHDNSFFDEALHVPMIVAGPGVDKARHDELTSLLDVTPTLLGVLGVESALPDNELRFGRNLLHAGVRRERAPFACWNDGMCEGFIAREAKVVRLMADHRLLAFPRSASFEDDKFRPPTPAELEQLEVVSAEYALTRLSYTAQLSAEPIQLPSGFRCGAGANGCRHSSRPSGGFHERKR